MKFGPQNLPDTPKKYVWHDKGRLYISNGNLTRLILLESGKAVDTYNPQITKKVLTFGTEEVPVKPEFWELTAQI